MKVRIQKVDLDTALTALLIGVSETDEIGVVREQAAPVDLADPEVVCIECGGSGQPHQGNFDHHDTDEPLPPACVQAYQQRSVPEDAGQAATLAELVDYVSLLETEGPEALKKRTSAAQPEDVFPTLSDVFSGMRLRETEPETQLPKGIAILKTVLERQLDPFAPMPELPEWQEEIDAKRANDDAIRRAVEAATILETAGGRRAGYVETDVMGALGELYRRGCEVGIAYNREFGHPPHAKYTIAGNGVRVDSLLPVLNEREPGWGGPAHGTIVGSPRGSASRLSPDEVLAIVRTRL